MRIFLCFFYFASFYHRIFFNYLPFTVYCKPLLATRKRDAAIIAAWLLSSKLRPSESFFQGNAVIGDHAPKIAVA